MPSGRRSARCIYVVLLGGCAIVGLLAGLVSTEIEGAKHVARAETLLSNAPPANEVMRSNRRRSARLKENKRRSRKYVDGRGIGRPQVLNQLQLKQQRRSGGSPVTHSVQTPVSFPKGIQFRVDEFFANGPGKKYNSKNNLDRLGINNPSLKSMTFLQWISKGDAMPRNRYYSILYFHIRKAAGTTIEKAMAEAADIMKNTTSDNVQAKTTRLFPWKYRRSKEYRESFQSKSMGALKIVQESDTDDVKVFTVIRDPVSRFLSGVSQQLESVNETKTNECIKATPRSTIDCVLDRIKESGLQFNIHYIPMAVNLKGVLRGQKVPIEIYEMKHLSQILTQFGADENTRENPGNAKDGVLSQINSSVLDDELINTICELFAIDVDMMHYLGLDVPYCDRD